MFSQSDPDRQPAVIPDKLKNALDKVSLAEIRYFDIIDSTNTYCLEWANKGADDFSLAIADHQSAGRGRSDRKWITNAGAGLAFSLILRPDSRETSFLSFFSPLGALAIRAALEQKYDLKAEIKWPNDVLVRRKKMAGILVENAWAGQNLGAIVVGIGVNLTHEALPQEAAQLFPATCVEDEVGTSVERWELLAEILLYFSQLRKMLGSREFFEAWSSNLAFRGERVCISGNHKPDLVGRLIGIGPGGDLQIETDDGNCHEIMVGDVRLRAV
jgi:BirA family biotin operon repressor/biotin-[acetyl-CoA-carboxylase] ligase